MQPGRRRRSARSPEELRQDILWGVRSSLVWIIVCSSVAFLAYFARGGATDRFGLGLPRVFALYWSGGISAGLLVGLLRPWNKRPVGRCPIGVVAMLPVSAMIDLLAPPGSPRPGNAAVSVLLPALILGPIYAVIASRKKDVHARASRPLERILLAIAGSSHP